MPRASSDVIDKLAQGISEIATERGISVAASKVAVKEALAEGVIRSKPLGPSFSTRVDSVMKLLGIKNVDVAIPLHLDSSYISRIRRGERTPNDKRRFAEVVAQVAALSCMERGLLKELVLLMGAENELISLDELDIDSALGLAEYIGRWLLGNQIVEADVAAIEDLFEKFDTMRYPAMVEEFYHLESPPSCPIEHEPEARFYMGEGFIWKAERDFLLGAAACGAKNLYLSSDIPALETELPDNWRERYRKALFDLINKGCHITIVHDAGRPLRESIGALKLWMPLYMTGHVTPLFLEGAYNRLFCHGNNVCECYALACEAIRGHEEYGRYYITSLPEDLEYYQKKMMLVLEKASVLLEIYRNDDEEGMRKFEREEAQRQAVGRAREVRPGSYENLRIVSYRGDCVVLYLNDPKQFRFVIRHPKIRYVVSQMS
ncbi:MAG: hypothetical protein IJI68_12695 [Eggerthellaceae bacterium]|nr:hypothetical protein [Eggerthellaceae bacterium]